MHNKKMFTIGIGLLTSVFFLSGCGHVPEEQSITDAQIDSLQETIIVPEFTCDSACNNYVNKCLKLVPNGDHVLYEDGYDSCIELCMEWGAGKIQCMSEADRCEAMTIECEL